MKIETKFDIGQHVFIIQSYPKEVFDKCQACNGTGEITLARESYDCPKCYGNGGSNHYEDSQWHILTTDNNPKNSMRSYNKIINIGIEINKKETKIFYYMGHRYDQSSCGNRWYEDEIFATEAEAQAECDKRNTAT
jgi:hypothetical protein